MTRRLLLFDDDALLVSVLRRFFDGKGWQVEAYLDAREALVRVEAQEPFDAVICDLHFTPARLSEGLQIVALVRRLRPGSAVLLFTGAGEAGVREEALRLGAHEVLTKPTPLASLHEAVVRAMKAP